MLQSVINIRNKNNELEFYFILFFHFYFYLNYFTLSIFRTLGLRLEVIGHAVTSVTSDGVVTTLIMDLREESRRF